MKKFNILFAIAMLFSFTMVLASCDKSTVAEKIDCPSSLTFAQLNNMAADIEYDEISYFANYTGAVVTDYDESYVKIPCLDSNIAIDNVNNRIVKPLEWSDSVDTISTVQTFYNDSSFHNTHAVLGTNAHVFYDPNLPIVLYVKASAQQTLCFIDNKGYNLGTYNFDFPFSLTGYETRNHNNFYYVKINTSFKTFYFKYTKSYSYTVSPSNKYEYEVSTYDTYVYDDGLKPFVNYDGITIAYIHENNGVLNIYDNYKKYLSTISVSSLGFDIDNYVLLNKSILFYSNEEYYKNVNEKSSKTTYKCRCLEINLIDGSTYYNDDFKYFITSTIPMKQKDWNTTKTISTMVNYYELNSLGEKTDIRKTIIVKDKLSFDSPSLAENITKVIKLEASKLLLLQNGEYYIVTKDGRKQLNGISELSFIGQNEIIFKGQDDLYYIGKVTELETIATTIGNGNGYITKNKFEDSRLFCSYDKNSDTYTCNGKVIMNNFLEYLNQDVFVTTNGIYIGNTLVLSTTTDEQVISLSLLYASNSHMLYKVLLNDGKIKFIRTTGFISNAPIIKGQ